MIEIIEALIGSSSSSSSGKRMKCPHCGKIAFVVIVAIIAGLIYIQPQWATENTVARHAKSLCHRADFKPNGVDSWDIPLAYKTEEVEEPLATKCTVTSAGRDGEFITDDDIVSVDFDMHVSRSVGKWAGEKAKSAVGAFMEGFKAGSPKDEE